MERRFDRDGEGGKLHMQSLCALAHYDFNATGGYGYEQALSAIQQMNVGYPALREMYRRMLFNVLARNQDDHTRNIAFLMDRRGSWTLAPAFDVVWAYNSQGTWTNRHQMTVSGKRDGFTRADLLGVAEQFGIKEAVDMLDEVADAVARWPAFAFVVNRASCFICHKANLGKYWDPRAELDLVALDRDGRNAVIAEVQWTARPIGPDVA